MIHLNYKPILTKVRNIINQQKQRKLTSIERLVVIKNFIIPRLNHLILTLPNPSKDLFYTDLEKELYYFLWNSKIHKIKKNTIIHDYTFGGFVLKMMDIIELTHALKSGWIRRLLKQKTNWKLK